MSDISISSNNTEHAVAEIINKVQTEIIEAGRTSESRIINIMEHSAGEFIESLKNEVAQEAAVINSVGELLIEMANYIQSAANAFVNVDMTYNTPKL